MRTAMIFSAMILGDSILKAHGKDKPSTERETAAVAFVLVAAFFADVVEFLSGM